MADSRSTSERRGSCSARGRSWSRRRSSRWCSRELCCRAIFGSPRIRGSVAAGLNQDGPASDAVLGMRMPPNAPGHDARGFRNAAAPERADLVAIGDSHTWGSNALIDEAWPQVLGPSLGRHATTSRSAATVRSNMRRSRRRPSRFVPPYRRRALRRERSLGRLLPRLGQRPLPRSRGRRARRTRRHPRHGRPALEAVDAGGEGTSVPRVSRGCNATSRSSGSPPGPASSKTAATKSSSPVTAVARKRPQDGFVFETAATSTGSHHFLPVPRSRPGRAAHRRGIPAHPRPLARIESLYRGAGVHILVASVPTKESVYYAVVRSARPEPDPGYERLVAAESCVSDDLASFCHGRGIAFHDLLPALRRLQDGTPLYPRTPTGTRSPPATRSTRPPSLRRSAGAAGERDVHRADRRGPRIARDPRRRGPRLGQLFARLRQPRLIGEILAGVVSGRSCWAASRRRRPRRFSGRRAMRGPTAGARFRHLAGSPAPDVHLGQRGSHGCLAKENRRPTAWILAIGTPLPFFAALFAGTWLPLDRLAGPIGPRDAGPPRARDRRRSHVDSGDLAHLPRPEDPAHALREPRPRRRAARGHRALGRARGRDGDRPYGRDG